jgi:hypothetical protein
MALTTRTRDPIPTIRTASPEVAPQPQRKPLFDRQYWLGHCQGFRVDGEGGRIGFVNQVEQGPEGLRLAVLAGRFGRRLLLIRSDEVEFIVPRAQRIWLRSPVTITASQQAPPD